jgi:hypothetical protein
MELWNKFVEVVEVNFRFLETKLTYISLNIQTACPPPPSLGASARQVAFGHTGPPVFLPP